MIYLIQYLCPNRHCIIAACYDDATGETQQHIQGLLLDRLRELRANPWCEICRQGVFHFERRETKFQSIAQALPLLKLAEADNLATRRAVMNARNQ
jgi:hypothetical protein